MFALHMRSEALADEIRSDVFLFCLTISSHAMRTVNSRHPKTIGCWSMLVTVPRRRRWRSAWEWEWYLAQGRICFSMNSKFVVPRNVTSLPCTMLAASAMSHSTILSEAKKNKFFKADGGRPWSVRFSHNLRWRPTIQASSVFPASTISQLVFGKTSY